MKKIYTLLIVFIGVSTLSKAQIRIGFEYPTYDNFNILDTNAAIPISLYNYGWKDNNDSTNQEYGITVYISDSTAKNNEHYRISSPIIITFAPYLKGFRMTQFIKINPVANTTFFGQKVFKVILAGLVGDSLAFNKGIQKIAVILDYDGSGIGLPKLSIKEYSVYPNPVKDILFIDGVVKNKYSILDLMGREIQSGESTNGLIDVNALQTGMYVLQSITEKGLIIQKFNKE